MQKDNLRSLIVSTALGVGPTNIVLGGQLGAGIGSIRVWQIELESSGAETITPFSNTLQIPGTIVIPAAGSVTLPATGVPWMETRPGEYLRWELVTGGTLTGAIWYSLA